MLTIKIKMDLLHVAIGLNYLLVNCKAVLTKNNGIQWKRRKVREEEKIYLNDN